MHSRTLFIAGHGGGRDIMRRNFPWFAAQRLPMVVMSPQDDPLMVDGCKNVVEGESGHAGEKMLRRFLTQLDIMYRLSCDCAIYLEYDQLLIRPVPLFLDQYSIGAVRFSKYWYSHYAQFKAEWFPIVPYFFTRPVLKKILDAAPRYAGPEWHEHGHLDRWLGILAQEERIPIVQVQGAWVALYGNHFDDVKPSYRDAAESGAFVLHPVKSQHEYDWVCQNCGLTIPTGEGHDPVHGELCAAGGSDPAAHATVV